jgi:hypothetical protein
MVVAAIETCSKKFYFIGTFENHYIVRTVGTIFRINNFDKDAQ